MNDVGAVKLLLLSRNEYLLSPKISRVYRGAEPGPQASCYVPCEECSRDIEPRRRGCGRVKNRKPCVKCLEHLESTLDLPKKPNHRCSLCKVCGGLGVRYYRHGDEKYEAYSDTSLEEAVRARDDDRTKEKPKSTEQPEGIDMDEEPAWRSKAAHEQRGSYAELEQQLQWLNLAHQPRYEMLMHWLDSKDQGGLWWSWSTPAEEGVYQTMVMLARRMSKPIRVPPRINAALSVDKRDGKRELAA